MSNPTLLKNMTAGAAINAFRLVKFSAADTVVLAAAATDSIIGVKIALGLLNVTGTGCKHFGQLLHALCFDRIVPGQLDQSIKLSSDFFMSQIKAIVKGSVV